jgi:inorganic pyrophosphatase
VPNLFKLPARSRDGSYHVVVETPRGARAKLKYDPELQVFVLSKSLMLGLSYPHDWGFIPSTIADDGDAIDALVIHDAATAPGLVLKCKVVGVLEIVDRSGGHKLKRNDRIIAVPLHSHLEQSLDDARDLPKQVREELEKFFVATDALVAKTPECRGWRGPKHAVKLIEKSENKFRKKNS